MKLIELRTKNYIYFINPTAITVAKCAEGEAPNSRPKVEITFTGNSAGTLTTLDFHGEEATRLIDQLRNA